MNPGAESLLPRQSDALGRGALLALLAHAGLLLALAGVLDWRTQRQDTVVSAELWASVPQAAPPPAAEPPPPQPATAPAPAPGPAPPPTAEPPPREADIALERRRQQEQRERREADEKAAAEKARAQKLAAEKAAAERAAADKAARQKAAAQKAAAEKAAAEKAAAAQAEREAAAAEARLAKIREENLRRMLGQAGGAVGTAATAGADAAPSAGYTARLAALIRANTVYTGDAPQSAVAEVEVRAGPGGSIIARRLVKSSGHPDWDDAVLRAIDRTARLPRDGEGRVPPVILISFRPRE